MAPKLGAMAITLTAPAGSIALPDNLIWEDEDEWDPLSQNQDYTLTGALVVEESARLAGRPVTLAGGKAWAWLTRAQLATLRALGDAAGVSMTLTLHDATSLAVTPRRDGPGGAWVEAAPLPVVDDSGPADPSGSTRYSLERVRLMEL